MFPTKEDLKYFQERIIPSWGQKIKEERLKFNKNLRKDSVIRRKEFKISIDSVINSHAAPDLRDKHFRASNSLGLLRLNKNESLFVKMTRFSYPRVQNKDNPKKFEYKDSSGHSVWYARWLRKLNKLTPIQILNDESAQNRRKYFGGNSLEEIMNK